MSEVMLPPWARPESPETLQWIDDATLSFAPAFGRGTTQRGIWADPRWGLKRRYRGLRSDEQAAILNALSETRGQLNILRVTPHTPLRGSFSTSELVSNNTFASGTTGWSVSGTQHSITVSDRVLRVRRAAISAATGEIDAVAATGLTQYAPYVARFMSLPGQGSFTSLRPVFSGVTGGTALSAGRLHVFAMVITGTTATFGISDQASSGLDPGDYFLVPYTSLARCALVDNGPNLLLRSDAFSTSPWTSTRCSVSSDTGSTVAPDGTSTADSIVEDSTATNSHFVSQDFTVSSSVVDYAYTVALKAGARTWALLRIIENSGSTSLSAYFNLSTGAVGTIAAGANWANVRAFSTDLGNGWYRFTVIGLKNTAATSLTALILMATADNTASYTGNGTSNIYAWRATMAQSSVPTRLVQTTSAAVTSTDHGVGLYTKGWPVSTNGLLLTSDWFEVNSELKRLTAPANSDASGLSYLRFRPTMAGTPADGDPVIIQEPFGRFIYPQGVRELQNMFGIYGDCEMDLQEIYA